jgi:hypothetical protein
MPHETSYAEFFLSGDGTEVHEVGMRDLNVAVALAPPEAYAFRFYDVCRLETANGGEPLTTGPVNVSAMCYIDAEAFTLPHLQHLLDAETPGFPPAIAAQASAWAGAGGAVKCRTGDWKVLFQGDVIIDSKDPAASAVFMGAGSGQPNGIMALGPPPPDHAHPAGGAVPGYARIYEADWRDIIEAPDGSVNRDALMRELADYSRLLRQTAIAYDRVTGGRISNPFTMPHAVENAVDELTQEIVDREVREALEAERAGDPDIAVDPEPEEADDVPQA